GLLLAAVAAAAAAQAGEDLEGFELASHCMACHGPAGRSPGAIPALNGRDRAFIVERLRAFRDGTRPSTVMGRLAKGYTDEEIARIADYIAGLGEVPGGRNHDRDPAPQLPRFIPRDPGRLYRAAAAATLTGRAHRGGGRRVRRGDLRALPQAARSVPRCHAHRAGTPFHHLPVQQPVPRGTRNAREHHARVRG